MPKNEPAGETSHPGGGSDFILDFIELIQAARDNLSAMQSLTQKYNFQLVKMASNLTDWMEMNDIAGKQVSLKWAGDTGPQKRAPSKNGLNKK